MAIGSVRAAEISRRIIILANSADSDSVRLAQAYAEKRQVPAENLLLVRMPQAETITWHEFVSTVWEPLQDQLVNLGWIDAVGSSLRDEIGRKKYAISAHRIAYLVVCRGVPLRIAHQPLLPSSSSPAGLPDAFQTNQAAVDSELALLADNHPPFTGYVVNPLFGADTPDELALQRIVKVSRLDGPTIEDALALTDHALVAESTGLLGRAYVDIGGILPEGDRWLQSTAREIARLGFDLEVDREPRTFPATARFDAPALYFGWYSSDLNGPFTLPGFRFPPGAIAVHIHSFSAASLRSSSIGWTGPLVARGVTATVGNVFEPYLQLTHRPDLLMKALARGENWGDAVSYACPAYSWQAISIGDPLYRPLVAPLRESTIPQDSVFRAYGFLRLVRQLENQHEPMAALGLLTREAAVSPDLALAWALGESRERTGHHDAAVESLTRFSHTQSLRPDQWGLQRVVASYLLANGQPSASVAIFRRLMAEPLPPLVKKEWLPEARVAAQGAGDRQQAERWRVELTTLTSSLEDKKEGGANAPP